MGREELLKEHALWTLKLDTAHKSYMSLLPPVSKLSLEPPPPLYLTKEIMVTINDSEKEVRIAQDKLRDIRKHLFESNRANN